MLKERIAVLKLERDRATAALERIKAQAVPPTSLEPAAIKRFGRLMRESVTCGDMPFRKAYRRPFSIVSSSTTISSVSSGENHAEQAIAGNAARIWMFAVPYGDGAPRRAMMRTMSTLQPSFEPVRIPLCPPAKTH